MRLQWRRHDGGGDDGDDGGGDAYADLRRWWCSDRTTGTLR
ncbi:hypothetical protein [Pedococcus aerophilus]